MIEEKTLLNKAWIIRRGFHGENEEKSLEKYGIKNKIVDIFNVRKDFDDISEHVKYLYRLKLMSFSEKAFLENYRFSRKNKKQVFGASVPVFTHYQTDLYRNIIKSSQNDPENPEYKSFLEKWKVYPKYILVGHNPYLEGRKVYNLTIYDRGGKEIIEFDEPLVDGTREHRIYKINSDY